MAEPALSKTKVAKASYPETRTTLDALHGQKMNSLLDEKTNVTQYKSQIEELKAKIAITTGIMEIWALEQQLEKLEKKVKSIESGDAINEYYLKTGNILFKYYDIQERIHNGGSMGTSSARSKPGSILAILNDIQVDEGVG